MLCTFLTLLNCQPDGLGGHRVCRVDMKTRVSFEEFEELILRGTFVMRLAGREEEAFPSKLRPAK